MTVRAVSASSVLLTVGGQWLIEVETTDLDGQLVDAAPTVAVTLPDGTDDPTPPDVELVTTGRYRAAYTVAVPGRHVAAAAAEGDVAVFAAHVLAVTAGNAMPDAADVVAYLGVTSFTEPEIQSALDAEAAAQQKVCRVGAVYPPDLAEALKRRVARNLAMRGLPLAVPQGDAEGGPSFVPGSDPEVRRLEAPHRRFAFG